MDPERWKRIERVYDRAASCSPEQRDVFLDELCNGDRELRREVESLLAAGDQAGSFLTSADLHSHVAAVAADGPVVATGQMLGRYEILSEIGAGAMGVVYLARDPALDRNVALKLLPPAFTADPERSARFAAEAKAASGLNHPNILTIHEIGEAGGVSFIATEFVDGVTLRQKIAAGPTPVEEALDIVLQCAAALSAAHDAGVVHRDIKPENIMVRRDGLVKVVDFGLARVAAGTRAGAGATQAGLVMGTPRYMSPEQARGERVDARSDIFSLGAVLYELIAGRPAVAGESTAEIFAALLGADAPAALPRDTHPDLERIVAKALRRERERRYDTMQAFAGDLTAVRQHLAGDRVHTDPTAVRRAWLRPGWKAAAVMGAAAAMVAMIALWAFWLRSEGGAPQMRSLAILPLVNLSNDPEQDYLADGITDQLTADLARSTSLRVISRTSAMQYKGARQPLPAIARTLNVDAVVEGSVGRQGGRVRITAQLLDARRDRHLWARTYERSDEELLALTGEMARDIGRELVGPAVSGAGAARARRVNPAAYELYLHGRHAWNRRTADGYRKALEYFNDAVEADPTYPPAYAGLADTYLLLGEYLIWPRADAFPRARAAAQTAIKLDDTLAQPYASLGQINANEWRWADADREFRRALERDPAYATGRQWRAEYLAISGRADEALAEIRQAQELDPLSLIINTQLGWILVIARQYEPAIAQLRRTIEMDPRFAPAYGNLGIANDLLGQHAEAIQAFEKAIELGAGVEARLWIAREHALAGHPDRARESLERLEPMAIQGEASPSTVALVYLALGEFDAALQWQQKGCVRRSLGPAVYPPFDPIRSDPRFVAIMRCMGLPSP